MSSFIPNPYGVIEIGDGLLFIPGTSEYVKIDAYSIRIDRWPEHYKHEFLGHVSSKEAEIV
jgi:hypothetical protein